MIAIMRPALVDRLAFAAEALVVVTIIANIAVTFSNAVVRYLTNQDFPWASDVWTILISIITFLGAPAYFRRGAGMAYTALIDRSQGLRRQTLQACGLMIPLKPQLAVLTPQSVQLLALRCRQAAVPPPAARSHCATQFLIDCAVGANSAASSSGVRPACTTATIWRRNSGA
jgi:hypothetical protein